MEYKIFWKYTYNVKERYYNKPVKHEVVTECIIERKVAPDNVITLTSGKSVCRPGDNFSKREGRLRSFKRATELIKHDKALKKQLWEQFTEMTPKSLKAIK